MTKPEMTKKIWTPTQPYRNSQPSGTCRPSGKTNLTSVPLLVL